jgi:hypothetical protein
LAWNGSCLQSVGPPCPAKCRCRIPAKPVLVLSSGLRRLYTTEASCWIQPHFEEMALQSPALVRISAAIQAYLDDGNETPSVQSMEHVDLALQTFRLELASRHEVMHAATLCAGLLLCTLRVRSLFIYFICLFNILSYLPLLHRNLCCRLLCPKPIMASRPTELVVT